MEVSCVWSLRTHIKKGAAASLLYLDRDHSEMMGIPSDRKTSPQLCYYWQTGAVENK